MAPPARCAQPGGPSVALLFLAARERAHRTVESVRIDCVGRRITPSGYPLIDNEGKFDDFHLLL
jgi:hypothetical protein